MDIDKLLKIMVEKGASDLFITAGVPPSIKVNGRVLPVTTSPLSPEKTRETVLGVMTESQRESFIREKECNFAISARGIGRFRASAFYQRNLAGMVLRRLKNMLRQAPDVIVIGEVRSRETMEHAITFAETGHLCLCTLHANNANQALDRILHFFPADRHRQLWMDLSLNLRAIVAQQLIPTPDGKGRRACIEVLLNTPLAQDLIRKGDVHALKEVMAKSNEMGMQTFDQALFELFSAGEITYEDALSHADSSNDLRLMIKLADDGNLYHSNHAVGGLSLEDDAENDKGTKYGR